MSDNGPQMTSGDTAEYMALCSIVQHFGRPGTPQDQAWIESLNGHIKAEYPHLTKIHDPQRRTHRLRGQAIRQARRDGMETARQHRLATHLEAQPTTLKTDPPDGA